MINDRLIDAGNVQLAVRDFGGDDPPLLLVHGAGGNLAQMTTLARALRPHHRVVTLDLRGHGRSADGDWSWDAALGDLAAVCVQLELERPAVVGHSLGGMLAALWGRPQATFASKVEVNGGVARVTREIDAGLEVIEVDLPAVITTDLRLNEPRFIKLPDIMKAKAKPLETIAFDSLGVESGDHHKVTRYAPPPKRSKGVMVKDVPELVAALKAKGLL